MIIGTIIANHRLSFSKHQLDIPAIGNHVFSLITPQNRITVIVATVSMDITQVIGLNVPLRGLMRFCGELWLIHS